MDPSYLISHFTYEYITIAEKFLSVMDDIKRNGEPEIKSANLKIIQTSNEISSLKNEIAQLKIQNINKISEEELDNINDSLDKLNIQVSKTIKKINSLKDKVFIDPSCSLKKYEPTISKDLSLEISSEPSPVLLKSKNKVIDFEQNKLLDLVNQKIYLDNEKYISLDKKSYEKTIQELEKKIQTSQVEESFKQKFLKKVKDNSRQEQRLLFQYLPKKDMKRVDEERRYISRDMNLLMRERGLIDQSALMKMSRLEVISHWIKQGEWLHLLKENKDNPDFSYQLIALYCEEKISLEELATAMTFDSAYLMSPSTCKIYELNKKNLELVINPKMTKKEKKTWLELSESDRTPKNLKFFISNHFDSFDKYTQGLISKTFWYTDNSNTPGVFILKTPKCEVAIVSFGLANSYYQRKSIKLAPIIGLSPDRLSMIERIKLGLSDYALFLRGNFLLIHGSEGNPFFSAMHDLLHTNGRKRRFKFQKPYVELAQKIEEKLLKSKTFLAKLNDGKGLLFPTFAQQPTKEEVVDYILEWICGNLVDGGYRLNWIEGQDFMPLMKNEVLRLCEVCLDETYYQLSVKKFLNDSLSIESLKKEVIRKISPLFSSLTPYYIKVKT